MQLDLPGIVDGNFDYREPRLWVGSVSSCTALNRNRQKRGVIRAGLN
jgi:hypothetical protein